MFVLCIFSGIFKVSLVMPRLIGMFGFLWVV